LGVLGVVLVLFNRRGATFLLWSSSHMRKHQELYTEPARRMMSLFIGALFLVLAFQVFTRSQVQTEQQTSNNRPELTGAPLRESPDAQP
jgi:hypothetical protein